MLGPTCVEAGTLLGGGQCGCDDEELLDGGEGVAPLVSVDSADPVFTRDGGQVVGAVFFAGDLVDEVAQSM